MDLPRYKCHKEVGALKIKALQHNPDGTLTITPEEPGFAPFNIEAGSVPRHAAAQPEVGWYFVEYENGYVSFSPAKPFEEGYTRIFEHTDTPIEVTAKQSGIETEVPAKAPKKKSE